jgi:hypothetical protein
MTAPDPALIPLANSLVDVGRRENADLLHDYLRGRRLPALGGDLTPAEILEAAIQSAPEVAPDIARVLARVLLETRNCTVLRNGLRFAATLPPHPSLFDALRHLRTTTAEAEDLIIPLWQALVYQQTDNRLLNVWLQMIATLIQTEAMSSAGRTLLFTAWRGLLWVPPEQTDPVEDVGPIVDFDVVEQGLLILHDVLVRQEDEVRWLRYALDILTETYPRSRDFWEAHFASRFPNWPPTLQSAALQKWPGLDSRTGRAASA